MQFRFSTLENVQPGDLIEVFNSAFADYFVKFTMNEKNLEIKLRTENTILEKSVGAFFEGKLVGFILLGIENGTAFNGGTGVLPEFRGNALTNRMYDFILPKLNCEGIYHQQLEVITKNFPAIKAYEKAGFQIARNLACFRGQLATSKINQDVELKFLDRIDPKLFPTFWNSQPSWQNSLSAMERTLNLYEIVGAFHQSNLVGYIIYGKGGSVKQFAVSIDFRHQGIGQSLFEFVQKQLEDKEINITNIDKSDKETISFLENLGLNLFVEQYEMRMRTMC